VENETGPVEEFASSGMVKIKRDLVSAFLDGDDWVIYGVAVDSLFFL
jgi:hypothetical protein